MFNKHPNEQEVIEKVAPKILNLTKEHSMLLCRVANKAKVIEDMIACNLSEGLPDDLIVLGGFLSNNTFEIQVIQKEDIRTTTLLDVVVYKGFEACEEDREVTLALQEDWAEIFITNCNKIFKHMTFINKVSDKNVSIPVVSALHVRNVLARIPESLLSQMTLEEALSEFDK